MRDLGRRAEPFRWTPVPRTAAGVDPQLTEPVQARGKRLLQLDEEIPREELTAVRVARQLQVEARGGGSRCRTWLMCEQELYARTRGSAGQSSHRVAALGLVEMMRAVIGDTGDDDVRAPVLEHHMLVHQHAHAEPAQLSDPCARARVVLVIAGDEIGAMTRLQSRHRLGVMCKLAYAAIDQIAGDRDHVDLELIDDVDDRID